MSRYRTRTGAPCLLLLPLLAGALLLAAIVSLLAVIFAPYICALGALAFAGFALVTGIIGAITSH